jgi:DNA repair protein RecN (Recombination protein N)
VLRELHISDLGVIEDLDLEFDPGLNVLTGETGAGKTMITVGLALALGTRASGSLVRHGATAARIQARFDVSPDVAHAAWADDGELVLARQVTAEGRSTARVGGQLTPVSTLAEIGVELVEAHGQHQGIRLLAPEAQTGFLDRFAGTEHLDTLERFREAYERLRSLEGRLGELSASARERERELDLLAYQVREIEGVAPRPGEGVELQAEEARLAHAERLLERAGAAEAALTRDEAGLDALRRGAAELGAAGEVDPAAAELAARASEVAAVAEELGHDLRAYREALHLDPDRLEQIRSRAAALRDLERKYGESEAEVLAYLARTKERMSEIGGDDDEREELERTLGPLRGELEDLARVVSETRAAAAPALADAVRTELRELGVEGAATQIVLKAFGEFRSDGAERAEFLFSGGPRQPLLPLAKVASGGELSRAMLACRSVMVDLDDVPTLVFDEVDAGIGGQAGVAVGRRLAKLAERRQVVVVTHLPQIASFADRHLRVEKRAGTAAVHVLDEAGRVAELSRMLAGIPGSDSAAVHAEELLAEADRAKATR